MLTLYGISLSTFTRKVRLALAERDIACTLQTAVMGSPQVRALNPLGRIPVLADGDVVVPDSSVIIDCLERAYPGPAGRLTDRRQPLPPRAGGIRPASRRRM
jgi:glutathione S-transferase